MSDQVSGRYQGQNPFYSILGQTANTVQGDVPARSNLEILGFGSTWAESGAITSEKGLLAAVPVTWGDSISNVGFQVTTESESGSEAIVALYSGVADGKKTKVIGESAVTKEQFKKEKQVNIALKESVLITPTNAPFGFVYAGVFSKETTATIKIVIVKVEKKYQFNSTTAKKTRGAYLALTEASTASFASAKEEFEVAEAKVTTEVPLIILT